MLEVIALTVIAVIVLLVIVAVIAEVKAHSRRKALIRKLEESSWVVQKIADSFPDPEL